MGCGSQQSRYARALGSGDAGGIYEDYRASDIDGGGNKAKYGELIPGGADPVSTLTTETTDC